MATVSAAPCSTPLNRRPAANTAAVSLAISGPPRRPQLRGGTVRTTLKRNEACSRIAFPSTRRSMNGPASHPISVRAGADEVETLPDDEGDTSMDRALAQYFVDNYVKDNNTVGVGTGPIVTMVIEELGARLKEGKLKGIKCVTAGQVSASECAFQGIPMNYLSDGAQVDVVVEEAAQVDVKQPDMPFIPWCADIDCNTASVPALVTTRKLLRVGARRVIVANSLEKVRAERLEGGLPVVIACGEGSDWEETAEELDDIFLGDADIWRRPSNPAESDDTDPRGGENPLVAADGTTVVDIRFYGPFRIDEEEKEYSEITKEIESVPGVVAHGLMLGVTDVLLVPGTEGDAVVTLTKEDNIQVAES